MTIPARLPGTARFEVGKQIGWILSVNVTGLDSFIRAMSFLIVLEL